MAKPIVEFTQEPPILLQCGVEQDIVLKVRPFCPGDCEVTLSLLFTSCSFADGEPTQTVTVTAAEMEDTLEAVFTVNMECEAPDTYFTLLFAHAVNAEGEKSYRKPMEMEIECAASLPTDTDADADPDPIS